MEKNRKKGFAAGAVIVLVAVILTAVYVFFGPKGQEGAKTIIFEVIREGKSEEFTIQTDAAYLGEALLAEELIAGEDSEYGLFVTEVNGIVAKAENQEWWCFTKGGEMVNTGVDQTPIEDGDHFEAALTEGY